MAKRSRKTERVKKDLIEEIVGAELQQENKIAARLRELHMSKAEFAQRVGLSYRQVSRLVRGRSDASLVTAFCVSHVLRLRIEDIWTVDFVTRMVAKRDSMFASA